MSGLIALLILILGGFSGYAAGNQTLTAQTMTALTASLNQDTSCIDPVPQEDSAAAIAMGRAVFDKALWSEPSTNKIYPNETTVTWLSNRYRAVAFLEYIHYDCGVSVPEIDAWGTADRFVTVFENFSAYQPTVKCEADGIRLFEFDVLTTDGSNDQSLYWVKQLSPSQIAVFNLILPDSLRSKQIRYAQQLFPELPTCAE